MFSSHEKVIDAPFAASSTRLVHLINWGTLRGISETAYYRGSNMLIRVGPFGGAPGLSKLVNARFLDPVRGQDSMTVALRWEATGVAGDLFPVFDGDLLLTAEDDSRSRLRLVGSYRPPLGRTGFTLDRAVMGRVADATVRSFVDGLATVMAEPASEPRSAESKVLRPRPATEPT
jgi:hypothetical protein